jgi:hypothetical protein
MTNRQQEYVCFSAFLVGLSWAICLLFSLYSATGGGFGVIEKYGQFGDFFGMINSLFTGLALVGLVYTVLLQRDQIDLQQKESRRQAREQFLTARLNARVAVLQAEAAQQELALSSSSKASDASVRGMMKRLNKTRMRIEILATEANQGFDSGVWVPAIEKEAIRQFLVYGLEELTAMFDQFEKDDDLQSISNLVDATCQELEDFIYAFRVQYPDMSSSFKGVIELLKRDPSNLKGAIGWCRSANFYFPRGVHPWV